jgi:hypothetical protein
MMVRDDPATPAGETIEHTSCNRSASLTINLRDGGGFAARFMKR